MNLDKYFKIDEDAFYVDMYGNHRFRGVLKYYGDTIRNDKAIQQAKLPATAISKVFSYVNEFLELLREDNGYTVKNVRCDSIMLDNIIHPIIDNGIICYRMNWESPIYNKNKRCYTSWDSKYDEISKVFNNNIRDLIWIKFTNKGHIGVVARGFDINFDSFNDNGKPISSDVLVKEVNESWDDSFVMLFPITSQMLEKYSIEEIELGIGNYLIDRGVPIIDYYSHHN